MMKLGRVGAAKYSRGGHLYAAGTYPNGRVALQILAEDHTVEATVTVNMPRVSLDSGELLLASAGALEGSPEKLEEAGLVEILEPKVEGRYRSRLPGAYRARLAVDLPAVFDGDYPCCSERPDASGGPGCLCGPHEKALRHISAGGAARGETSPHMTPFERAWCIQKADEWAEGARSREDLARENDQDLARSTLHAMADYARSQGGY